MSDELGALRTVVDDSCAAVSADEAIERSRGRAPSAGFHRPARSRPHLMVVGAAAAFVVIGGLIWQQSTGPSVTPVDVVPAQQRPTTTLEPSPTLANGCPVDMPEEFLTTSSLPFDKSIYLMGTTCGHMMMVAANDDRAGWVSIDEIAEAEADVEMIPVYDDRGNQIAWWANGQLGWIELETPTEPGWNVRDAAGGNEDEMIRGQVDSGSLTGMRLTAPPRGLRIEHAVRPKPLNLSAERLVFVPDDESGSPSGGPARLELTFVVDQRAEQSLAEIAARHGTTSVQVGDRSVVIYDDGEERVGVWARAGVLLVTARSVGIDDVRIMSLANIVTFL
jgi:hypothetical protein